jgi:hypothetical protein
MHPQLLLLRPAYEQHLPPRRRYGAKDQRGIVPPHGVVPQKFGSVYWCLWLGDRHGQKCEKPTRSRMPRARIYSSVGGSLAPALRQKPSQRFNIGSTHTWTTRQFIDDLKVLDLGGVGSKAIPNGLHELRGQRPYQEYYDQKYYTQDAPPPSRPSPDAPPSRAKLTRPVKISPTPSSQDPSTALNEKKKKKGLFKF